MAPGVYDPLKTVVITPHPILPPHYTLIYFTYTHQLSTLSLSNLRTEQGSALSKLEATS